MQRWLEPEQHYGLVQVGQPAFCRAGVRDEARGQAEAEVGLAAGIALQP